jgi:hypothetical protein
MAIKYTTVTTTIPNGHETHKNRPVQGFPKCTQICFLGMKIQQLATLFPSYPFPRLSCSAQTIVRQPVCRHFVEQLFYFKHSLSG